MGFDTIGSARSTRGNFLSLRKTGVVAAVALLALTGALSANAQPIERTDFSGGELTETFTDLGLAAFGNPAPLILNGITYTTEDGFFRYNNFAAFSTGQGFGNDGSDTGFIDIVFSVPFARVGLDIGASTSTVQFFDAANNLLSSQASSAASETTFDFVGFQSAGGIQRVRVTDISSNARVVVIDNVSRENVTGGGAAAPEPGTLALLALGVVGGAVARRRK